MCVCIYLYYVLHYRIVAITTYKRRGRERKGKNKPVSEGCIYVLIVLFLEMNVLYVYVLIK